MQHKNLAALSTLVQSNYAESKGIHPQQRSNDMQKLNSCKIICKNPFCLMHGFDMDVVKDAYSLPEARSVFSKPASPHAIH